MRGLLWLSLALWLGCGGAAARAQVPDTVLSAHENLAQFRDARALAVDTRGFLYVADAGRDVVDKLAPDGAILTSIGGPGSDHGQFDGPSDVDPTNGLVVVVADMGNGRLQRFSGASLHMETLPVLRSEAFLAAGEQDGGEGQPMAVATSPSSEIFALERFDGVVLKWDAWRRPERIIGAYGNAGASLREPVALAVDESRLFVADAVRDAVLVYDHFGGFSGMLAEGLARLTRAMAVLDGHLWLVLSDAVVVHSPGGGTVRTLRVDIDEELVDARPYGGFPIPADAIQTAAGGYLARLITRTHGELTVKGACGSISPVLRIAIARVPKPLDSVPGKTPAAPREGRGLGPCGARWQWIDRRSEYLFILCDRVR